MMIRLPWLAAIYALVLALGLAAASNAQQELLKSQLCCEGCADNAKACKFQVHWSIVNCSEKRKILRLECNFLALYFFNFLQIFLL